ncbi:hypothetical protein [Allonocardiopsis opalescens]|uniref:Uncharacterized protein n=1 Tax=Allonocardiopsis opalescens TaxID=1144618 RepID=A0A2T0Q7E3_9ACTN|nr:hypothetical protein [Allonocardiopsis opalescens]PRX99722.1 hypothetical protein CLV72_103327 [Allonocardiopsis opalescens]
MLGSQAVHRPLRTDRPGSAHSFVRMFASPAILRAHPAVRGMLFDQPQGTTEARIHRRAHRPAAAQVGPEFFTLSTDRLFEAGLDALITGFRHEERR